VRLPMSNDKWLNYYSGQTVDELLALEGEYRIDSLVLAFEQAIDQKADRKGEQSITIEERIVLAVEALEREVNNGGYHQFFANSSREFASSIIDALSRIGCPRTAELTQKAIDALRLQDLSAEAIEAAIAVDDEERDEEFDRCDQLYYQAAENIEQQLFAFIRANKAAFDL
jgi:hypothetical protein